jgi:hypothetical protein
MEYIRCKCTQENGGGGGGICAETGYPLNLPSPTNLARLGHFPPASQAGRLAGPVFYLYVFSLVEIETNGDSGSTSDGVLPCLVQRASLEGTTDFCPALAALVWHCTKYFFLTSHCFTSFVLIA